MDRAHIPATPSCSPQHQKLLNAKPQLCLRDFFFSDIAASSALCRVSQGCWGFAGLHPKLISHAQDGRIWQVNTTALLSFRLCSTLSPEAPVGLRPSYPHLLMNTLCTAPCLPHLISPPLPRASWDHLSHKLLVPKSLFQDLLGNPD